MAQKRMLDKKISLSEKVADLPLGGQLLYTWMIPHADDFGFLQGSPRTLKAQVIPMVDCTVEEVTEWLDAMIKAGLIHHAIYNKREYFIFIHFLENQKIRKDIQPYSILPIKLGEDVKANWKNIEDVVSEILNNGTDLIRDVTDTDETDPEVKLSKVKLSKYKQQQEVVEKIPNKLIINRSQELTFLKEFVGLTTTELREQVVKCNAQMNMSSQNYTNPGLYFKGWLKNYMTEKTKKDNEYDVLEHATKNLPNLTEEQVNKNLQKLAEIKNKLRMKGMN